MKTFDSDRKALVASLMEIVAAPAEPELLAQGGAMEQAAFNAGELAQIAAQLLRLLLALYGASHCLFKLVLVFMIRCWTGLIRQNLFGGGGVCA